MKAKTAQQKKSESLSRRKGRVRSRISGTMERPRLVVNKSNRYTVAAVIDDVKGITLISLSTVKVKAGKYDDNFKKVADARALGQKIADIVKEKKITKVVFDRGGSRYHGKVKALADAAREVGLVF